MFKRLFMPGAALLAGVLSISGCTRGGLIAAVTPGGEVRRTAGIPFGTHERYRLDTYAMTPGPQAANSRPALVVFFYGGTWRNGSRELYEFVGKALASRGHPTVIADYRLYPEVRYPDFLRDNALAVAWAVKHAQDLGADPNRIVLMGHSAGAYNAAMLALQPEWLKQAGVDPGKIVGFVGLAGPYDFYPIVNPDAKPVFFHPNYPPDSQPINFVSGAAPPSFLAAGTDDDLVNPQRNTQELANRLRAHKVPTVLKSYEGVGHIGLIATLTGVLRWRAPVLDDVDQFLRQLNQAGQ